MYLDGGKQTVRLSCCQLFLSGREVSLSLRRLPFALLELLFRIQQLLVQLDHYPGPERGIVSKRVATGYGPLMDLPLN